MRAAILPLLLLGMLRSADAQAGGLGVMTAGGLHQTSVYVYDPELQQFRVNQQRPNLGVGLQAVLGDRDDRVQGVMRVYYQLDSGQTEDGVLDAAKADGAEGDLTFAYDAEPRHLGMASVGVQWGLLKSPGAIQPTLITAVGAGALTNNNTEFAMVQVGPGMYWSLTEQLQLNAELTADVRYRKQLSWGMSGSVGLRFLFD